MFLALCATGLAYWFGARSFKLTEMSFKVVSQDIKEAAQTHRDTTISLIERQQKIKLMEIEESRNLQIIHELCAIENCIDNIHIMLKKASDKGGLQSLSKEDTANTLQAVNSLRIHIINIIHFVKAYKDKDLKQDGSTVHQKINTILLMLNNEGQKDTELSNLIDLTNDFVSTIHNLLKQKAA